MEKYFYLFFPTTNAIGQVNQSAILIAMMAFIGASVIYIILGIRKLARVIKNRDYSLKQTSYIIFKILFILLLLYISYELGIIILELS